MGCRWRNLRTVPALVYWRVLPCTTTHQERATSNEIPQSRIIMEDICRSDAKAEQFLLPARQRQMYMPRPQFGGYHPQNNGYGEGYPMQAYPPPPPGKPIQPVIYVRELIETSLPCREPSSSCLPTSTRRIKSQSYPRMGFPTPKTSSWS